MDSYAKHVLFFTQLSDVEINTLTGLTISDWLYEEHLHKECLTHYLIA